MAKTGYAVLVTGARDWEDIDYVRERLSRYPAGTWIIHGNCNGADTAAKLACKPNRHVEISVPYIGWLGKRGGPTRNEVMLQLLLGLKKKRTLRIEAFHTDLKNSRGTRDMVLRAKRAGLRGKINRG